MADKKLSPTYIHLDHKRTLLLAEQAFLKDKLAFVKKTLATVKAELAKLK